MSAGLFGQPIPADLDPAFLLNELRALAPLMQQLASLRDLIEALEAAGITPAQVQELARAIDNYRTLFERIDQAGPKIDRIDELIQLLDQLEIIARRQ